VEGSKYKHAKLGEGENQLLWGVEAEERSCCCGLDGPGLRLFIGKSGRGIRGFLRLTGKRVWKQVKDFVVVGV